MAYTLAQLRNLVREKLRDWGEATEPISGAITSAATTYPLSNTYGAGTMIEFQDDGEQCTVTTSGTTPTVRRGSYGTTAAAHAAFTNILRNPRFTLREIDREINFCLTSELEKETSTIITARETTSFDVLDFSETFTGSNVAADTVNYMEGSQGLKLTSTSGATTTARYVYTTAEDDFQSSYPKTDFFTFWVYLDVLASLSSASIVFHNAYGSKYFTYSITGLAQGWNYVEAKKSDFTTTGAATWASISDITLNVISAASAQVNVTFDILKFRARKGLYDLPSGLNRVLKVEVYNNAAAKWGRYDHYKTHKLTGVSSTNQIELRDTYSDLTPIRVWYTTGYTSLATSGATCDLSDRAQELPAIYAAIKLTGGLAFDRARYDKYPLTAANNTELGTIIYAKQDWRKDWEKAKQAAGFKGFVSYPGEGW